jgi:ABC-type sugar transport system substrate-binding protein
MKFLRTLLATATLAAFFALSVPSFAQEQNERDRMKQNQTTVTGCLSKGDSGDWVITEQNGNKMTVMGKTDFTKHANHTVKLTGTPSEDGKTFNATNIESVSDSCQAK